MLDIVALGELLIDFTECGYSKDGQRLFEQNPGGAVANVACGAARLGLKTAFVGKAGADMHGRFLKKTLMDCGVNTDNLLLTDEVFTTLAFVSLSLDGEREFSFARKPGADTCLWAGELQGELLRGCRILHVGSLSMTDEPARTATLRAIELAKAGGARISYDPNYRAALWSSEAQAKEQMRRLLPFADYIKMSEEETVLLTDMDDPVCAAQELVRRGAACCVVTRGRDGALTSVPEGCVEVPTYTDMPVVDTTGAGDSFWAAFLYGIAQRRSTGVLTCEEAEAFARWANAAASLCVGKRGAIPAMPDMRSLEEFMASKRSKREIEL